MTEEKHTSYSKLIICARKNSASINMHTIFCQEHGFIKESDDKCGEIFTSSKEEYKDTKILLVDRDILDIDNIVTTYNTKHYIIASTHSSVAGDKTLTVHVSGNWGAADYGGEKHQLPFVSPAIMRSALIHYKELAATTEQLQKYKVCFEATHHGPSKTNAPITWVEVGGTQEEWDDTHAIKAACKVMLHMNDNNPKEKSANSNNSDEKNNNNEEHNNTKIIPAVAYGGTHYVPEFSKDRILNEYSIGHVCAKYNLEHLNEELFLDAIKKTVPSKSEKQEVHVLIDWKGTPKEYRDKIIELCEKHKITYKRSDKIR